MYSEHAALRKLSEIMQAWAQHVSQWWSLMGNDTFMLKALHAPVLRQEGDNSCKCMRLSQQPEELGRRLSSWLINPLLS